MNERVTTTTRSLPRKHPSLKTYLGRVFYRWRKELDHSFALFFFYLCYCELFFFCFSGTGLSSTLAFTLFFSRYLSQNLLSSLYVFPSSGLKLETRCKDEDVHQGKSVIILGNHDHCCHARHFPPLIRICHRNIGDRQQRDTRGEAEVPGPKASKV